MKRNMMCLLTVVLCLSMLAGCGGGSSTENPSSPTQENDQWNGEFGPISSTDAAVVCVEPTTGTRITFPGIFNGAQVDELGSDYQLQYSLGVAAPEDSNRIYEASAGVGIRRDVTVSTMAEVYSAVDTGVGGAFADTYTTLEQTDEYLRLVAVGNKLSDSDPDEITYYWCYPLSDGTFLEIQMSVAQDNHRELADAVVIEYGAYPVEGAPTLAGYTDIGDPGTAAAGSLTGSWYAQDDSGMILSFDAKQYHLTMLGGSVASEGDYEAQTMEDGDNIYIVLHSPTGDDTAVLMDDMIYISSLDLGFLYEGGASSPVTPEDSGDEMYQALLGRWSNVGNSDVGFVFEPGGVVTLEVWEPVGDGSYITTGDTSEGLYSILEDGTLTIEWDGKTQTGTFVPDEIVPSFTLDSVNGIYTPVG